MGKEGGIKIDPHASLLCKLHPLCEMPGYKLIAVRMLSLLKNGIACVQVQLLFSRHQSKGLVHVLHQLLRCLRPSRIIAGCLDSSGEGTVVVKSGHVISLPAVE